MATLTTQFPVITGTVVTYVAAAVGGDVLVNDGNTLLRVVNASAVSVTVTVTAIHKCNQDSLHHGGGAVAAGVTKEFGPFDQSQFGTVPVVTYTAVTDVTVAAVSAA